MIKVYTCQSCGKVLKNKEDFAGEIFGNPFCKDCTDELGFRKTYSNIIGDTKNFLIEQMSVSEEEAEKMAEENVSKIPFWVKREELMQNKDLLVITDVGSTTTKAVLLKKESSGFKIIEIYNSPTTVEKPLENVNIGVFNSIRKLEEKSDLKILTSQAESSNFEFNENVLYLTTSSAGGGLQILVIGLTLFDSASSGERTAYGAGGVILDTFAIDDKRTSLEQMQEMNILHPDIILMCGGIDGGAVSSLLRLGEILQLAEPSPKFGEKKEIPLVFAGNIDAQPFITSLFKDRFELYLAPNLRPTMKTENLFPAREKIHKLFMDNVMEQAPGYSELKKKVSDNIIPTPLGVIHSLQLISQNLDENVMSVDIGGATTDIFSNIQGEYFRTVSANYGLSYSISNVMKEAGFESIRNRLPKNIDDNYTRNYISNKMLYPTFNPTENFQIAIEQAIAKEAIGMSKKQHLKMNFNTANIGFLEKVRYRDLEKITEMFYFEKEKEKHSFHIFDINIMIGAGGVISHTQNRKQAFAMIIDGFQPQGITEIWRDKDFITPHLGKLSEVNEKLASELLEKDCFEKLGIYIKVLGKKFKQDHPVMKISHRNETKSIKVNELLFWINDDEQTFEIQMEKGFYLNGTDEHFTLKTALPILIDTREKNNFESLNNTLNLFDFEKEPQKIESSFRDFIQEKVIEKGSFIHKVELPYAGNILVSEGQEIFPETVIGENLYDPPKIYVISLFDKTYLHLNEKNIKKSLLIKEGEEVKIGTRIAEIGDRSFIDELTFQHYFFESPIRGKVEKINYDSGTIVLREIQDYSYKPKIVNVAKKLNIPPKLIKRYMKKELNDFVYAGDLLASKIIDAGGVTYPLAASVPTTGTIKEINTTTGKVTIKYDKDPYRKIAGIKGKISEIDPDRSATIYYEGFNLNGIIGFGSEANGKLRFIEKSEDITKCGSGDIVIIPEKINIDFLKKATKSKVNGIIAPSIDNSDLVDFTGEEIGVALTGNENIPFPLILTEGFGDFEMENNYCKFFQKNNGKSIYINGHTQIRAGVTRPEIIVN